jgi:hypothetical protein
MNKQKKMSLFWGLVIGLLSFCLLVAGLFTLIASWFEADVAAPFLFLGCKDWYFQFG